ncbi:MAG TPA: hypothetical protein DEQ98_01320 [Acidobacteria bacterium]|nr:hypothetical protein [Acidobacteriota bacterium]
MHATSDSSADKSVDPNRSALMKRVRRQDTAPEMIVRRLLHRMGYRYRLHARDLPGRPDIVFRRLKKVVFVHGCFWHRHHGCRRSSMPKRRSDFWAAKFDRNVLRDRQNVADLEALGWRWWVVWECKTRDIKTLKIRDWRVWDPFARPPSPAIGRSPVWYRRKAGRVSTRPSSGKIDARRYCGQATPTSPVGLPIPT